MEFRHFIGDRCSPRFEPEPVGGLHRKKRCSVGRTGTPPAWQVRPNSGMNGELSSVAPTAGTRMTTRFANAISKHPTRLAACLAVAGFAILFAMGGPAAAKNERNDRSVESNETRNPGEPILAVVSLRSQAITIYDANGWILRAPVSSGQKGRETPAGIFSVLQKDADHYSNLYEDGYMPHMQRLTWSGIALHGGRLPGYPASHGCVRMPFAFAAGLFATTQLGMRVIVAPADTAPFEIAHPTLFPSQSAASALAAARAAEAAEAAKTADQARLVAVGAAREAARAMIPVRVAENLKLRAEQQLAAAEATLATSDSAEAKTQAEDAKTKALDKIAELRAQWAAAKADLQPK